MWERELVLGEHQGAELDGRRASLRVVGDHRCAQEHDRLVLAFFGEGGHAQLKSVREHVAQGDARLHQFDWSGERNRCAIVGIISAGLDHDVLRGDAVLVPAELGCAADAIPHALRRVDGLRSSARLVAQVRERVGSVGEHGADPVDRDERRHHLLVVVARRRRVLVRRRRRWRLVVIGAQPGGRPLEQHAGRVEANLGESEAAHAHDDWLQVLDEA